MAVSHAVETPTYDIPANSRKASNSRDVLARARIPAAIGTPALSKGDTSRRRHNLNSKMPAIAGSVLKSYKKMKPEIGL